MSDARRGRRPGRAVLWTGLGLLAVAPLWACASGGGGGADDTEEIATDAPGAPLPGTYQGEMPAASSPGRLVTLNLQNDGAADMRTDYANGRPPIVQRGTWSLAAPDRARVNFTELDGRPIDETIIFQLRGTTLTAVEYDRAAYGSEGLTLERR